MSRILKKAPTRYIRSYLYTESDDNDLTYFYRYHLEVLCRSIEDLHGFLAAQMVELREMRHTLDKSADLFNPRQLAVLQHALKNPAARFDVQTHKTSHRIATETARSDLTGLESLGLLQKTKSGKRFVFDPIPGLTDAIKALGNSSAVFADED